VQQPLTPAQAVALSQNVNTPVVVLLRNAAQAPLLSELTQVHAQRVHGFQLADAVAATVSPSEESRLAANPAVAEVVPDSLIKGAPTRPTRSTPDSGANAVPNAVPAGACPAPGKTMLEPEALSATHTDSDDPTAKTAHSLGFTGAGVKVGYIADGIDVNNPDFIRSDGSHVFADYQDFTGDGPNAPTSGDEAFLDASAIAAQGRQTYNVQNFGAHPLPNPCDIRILGVAPGSSLYGFKVFGQNSYSTTSGLLQAIDYAVHVDHVNVLNESFGYNPFPDTGSADAVKLFNDMATAAGTTVSVSSGDAGITGTEGSPGTDPHVIEVGASTTFRWYEQTDYGAAGTFGTGGWLNDNVSSLSSSGIDQAGRTINLLAPGDSSFAVCTPDLTKFAGCADFNGKGSTVERSGGTSESSPLTAGAAALVIQAYRQAHYGASPDPALVKQILVSTADDLTEPGDEQGAGLLDSYRAVQAALSIQDDNGAPAATGATLLTNTDELTATGAPGSGQQWKVSVTNTGAGPQTVDLSGRGFGAARTVDTGDVTLSDQASPKFADWSGVSNNYGTLTFAVPPNTDRLSASIAYPGDPNVSLNARTRMILIDPLGRFAAHSLPQGVGDFGNADVRFPAAGTWKAIIYSRVSASGGTLGKVRFQADTANTTGFGSVSPATLTLAPGQTGSAVVTASTPAQPGDASASLVLKSGGSQNSLPIVLRSLVPTGGSSGSFHGVLTGGNGRQPDIGQENFYQFDVPAGQHDLDASVDLSADAGDNVVAYLVDPDGNSAATGINRLTTAYDPSTRAGTLKPVPQTDLYVRDPRPGRWTLVVNFAGAIVGDRISQPFSGTIGLNRVAVTAAGLPHDPTTTLPAGKPVTAHVTVRNTGTAPEDFFVDPRSDRLASVSLAAVEPTTLPLPMPGTAASPAWLVPTETTDVAVVAQANQPVAFDYGPEAGDPDLPALITGPTAIGSVQGKSLPAGVWAADPAELGPSGPNGEPAGSVSMSMIARTKPFDTSVSSTAGDLWTGAVTPASSLSLVTVQPGQTVDIPVTITPSGPKGSVVRGTLFVDNLVVGAEGVLNAINFADPADTEPSGDELAGIPYVYSVG
jgi:hypothetical protein